MIHSEEITPRYMSLHPHFDMFGYGFERPWVIVEIAAMIYSGKYGFTYYDHEVEILKRNGVHVKIFCNGSFKDPEISWADVEMGAVPIVLIFDSSESELMFRLKYL